MTRPLALGSVLALAPLLVLAGCASAPSDSLAGDVSNGVGGTSNEAAEVGVLAEPTDEQPYPDGGQLVITAGQCVETPGVTLVIDPASLGGEVKEFCAVNFIGTSWELLKVAGANPEGTANYPVGFVCRLLGLPAADAQDCQDTPSYAEGSWGFFTASDADVSAGKWAVSGVGAAWRKPSCGQADAWRFIAAGESMTDSEPAPAPSFLPCG